MGAMASQITSLAMVYSTVYSGAENTKAPRHWPINGEFPAPMASNAENVFPWWRHHEGKKFSYILINIQQFSYMKMKTQNVDPWLQRINFTR